VHSEIYESFNPCKSCLWFSYYSENTELLKTKFGNIFQDFNRYEMKYSVFPAPYWARGGAVFFRHCATTRKVAGSIPDGIFHCHNPFGRTMTLGSTQLLTEMSTRNISWGVKAAGAYG